MKLAKNFDDHSYDEFEESLDDIDPDDDGQPYFPLDESKPPHY